MAENVARMGERRGAYREFHIHQSVLYNSVVTPLNNDCTQFYQNRNNATTQQLLHVSGLTGTPSGSIRLYETHRDIV